jgi:hypothetical protein
VASRINRAIELLAQDQAIYYVGNHTGHVLTAEQGRADSLTWADYINIGMEHGAFDMTGLADYLNGLAAAGPTRSGHRTPTVIVEAPVNGTDEANVHFNAWQFRQILGRGAHGVLLCQAETAGAVRAFVESCRYPHHPEGVVRNCRRRCSGCAAKVTDGAIPGRGFSESAPAAAVRRQPRRQSGACRKPITWIAATRGR